LKYIDQSSKGKSNDGKSFKKQMEKLLENTKKNGKKSFNGTPKCNSMGCYQNEGHKVGVQSFGRKTKFVVVIKNICIFGQGI